MENVRKPSNIKLGTMDDRRNYLVSQPNCHRTKYFSKYLLAIEMKKAILYMNKPVFRFINIKYQLSSNVWEFSCKYIWPKYRENSKLC